MKIANIIYEDELVNHTKVDYVNYINSPTAYCNIDNDLPTLYVGWNFMKASNPNNQIILTTDILDKRIVTNELYWELSFKEGKASHVKGVDKFAGLAPEFYFKPKHTYTNLDPVFFQLRDIQDLMDVCPKKIDKLYNYKNEFVYILSDNNIWGLDLRMYEFFKFSIVEILNGLQDRTNDYALDTDGEIYQSYYKIFPNFELLKRYLVSILSK
jgi:hypothetical protein